MRTSPLLVAAFVVGGCGAPTDHDDWGRYDSCVASPPDERDAGPDCADGQVAVSTGEGVGALTTCRWMCDDAADCPIIDGCTLAVCLDGTVVGVPYCVTQRIHGTANCQ